jgi:uncharacterized protein (DUF302 family)
MFFLAVDQSKLASDAGIKLRPSTLLVFCNPALGSQFITSNPDAGIDWPVRLLISEDEQVQGGPCITSSSSSLAAMASRIGTQLSTKHLM